MSYERSYGYRYQEGEKLTTVEISKLIRTAIKQEIREGLLPARWKYSVRSHSYAGGSAIDVQVTDCLDAWTPCPGYRIGTRHEHPDGGWTATGCGDPWCKTGGIHKDLPDAQEHDVLTEEAEAALATLRRIHGAFNHDGSDIMTDYFDVNYYGTVAFQSAQAARWAAEEQASRAARRAALDTAEEAGHVIVHGRERSTVHAAVSVAGKIQLLCGARLWGSYSTYSRTDEPVTCSRCAKKVGT